MNDISPYFEKAVPVQPAHNQRRYRGGYVPEIQHVLARDAGAGTYPDPKLVDTVPERLGARGQADSVGDR